MPRPIRNNQPHTIADDLTTLQGYAVHRLQIALAPKPIVKLDAEVKTFIDAAHVVLVAGGEQHRERLRAIFREILRLRVDLTYITN